MDHTRPEQRKITIGELPAPFTVKEVKQVGIESYDLDNNYPSRMERLINGSVTAKSSAGMLSRFLIGDGFKEEALNKIEVGRDRYERPITAYKLLRQIAHSISYYAGFYVRAQFDANINVTKLVHEDFRYCRFGKKDTQDYSGLIVVYNNWDKAKDRKIDKKDLLRVHVWNMNQDVIKSQVDKAGGFQKYNGQMFFAFEDEYYLYPLSPIDPVYYDADTENQISKFKNGELRRGFYLKKIIHHNRFETEKDAKDFTNKIMGFQGGGHQSSLLVMEGTFDKDGQLITGENIKIENIEQNINDKIFETYEKSVINNIRKAYNAIPQILVDYEDSKLGTTSGEALFQASAFYNQMTKELRRFISESFVEMFSRWKDEELRGQEWIIEPAILGEKSEGSSFNLDIPLKKIAGYTKNNLMISNIRAEKSEEDPVPEEEEDWIYMIHHMHKPDNPEDMEVLHHCVLWTEKDEKGDSFEIKHIEEGKVLLHVLDTDISKAPEFVYDHLNNKFPIEIREVEDDEDTEHAVINKPKAKIKHDD